MGLGILSHEWMAMLSPQFDVQDGVTVVSFAGGPHSLDEGSLNDIREGLLTAGLAEPPRVVIDLSQVEFFGSSFIELLFRTWKRLQDRSGRFALCGVSPYCREVLTITNLNKLWRMYDTREEAIEALNAPE